MRTATVIAALLIGLLTIILPGVQGEEAVVSEAQCRPYIEKALKHLGTEGSHETTSIEDDNNTNKNEDDANEETIVDTDDENNQSLDREKRNVSTEVEENDDKKSEEHENDNDEITVEITNETEGDEHGSTENVEVIDSKEDNEKSKEAEGDDAEDKTDENASSEKDKTEESTEDKAEESNEAKTEESVEEKTEDGEVESGEKNDNEKDDGSGKEVSSEEGKEEETDTKSQEEKVDEEKQSVEEEIISKDAAGSLEQEPVADETKEEESTDEKESSGDEDVQAEGSETEEGSGEEEKDAEVNEDDEEVSPEEEELIMEIEIPEVLRPRDHINPLLKLDEENEEKENALQQGAEVILRDLKRLYDNAIKPLETLYKYRDLSNRHFGDPEIFSKPLVLFMGPWSGGKSSIINYLLDIEYKPTSLRTGAEPSPAYFNIIMHGEEDEVLDGTQLAADWTFSGLQKFGQGLLDRLKGYKLNNKLLEKVNIVEIPGILEIRKQVQRLFPFNDACQWFIDRADIIFLVYDPAKLDVGPETEAILDQLKGREYQTRIILNKADQVKPEELMRVQGALIWNISPLMSSAEPPVMYSASLWSIPYESGAPTRLLYAQERAFLRDLRTAIDKRVEHKIASARRFAVRVRNHAKMVDCYLTTYYNQKSIFAKKKEVSDRITENPQDYHIYEGLSTLTNISRYDLPDPDVYRDFFRLNSLYDFQLLSSTCTYFRGCPINRLDIAIAYDLPELVGKYKKSAEAIIRKHEEATASEATMTTAPPPTSQQQQQQQKPTARSGASRISMS